MAKKSKKQNMSQEQKQERKLNKTLVDMSTRDIKIEDAEFSVDVKDEKKEFARTLKNLKKAQLKVMRKHDEEVADALEKRYPKVTESKEFLKFEKKYRKLVAC